MLVFWDYAAAFPSVRHDFVFDMLPFMGFPVGFQRFVQVTYSFVEAVVSICSGLAHFCHIQSGVLQGDPLSGLLFVLTMHPALHHFETRIEKKGGGCVRACADDRAMALPRLLPMIGCPPNAQGESYEGRPQMRCAQSTSTSIFLLRG